MNRLKSPLRRALAIAAGATIGMVGAVALATPASAHHPIPVGLPVCKTADGDWKIVWKVWNSERDLAATLTEVSTDPAETEITGEIFVGAELPTGSDGIRGEQMIPSEITKVTLTVTAEWLRVRPRKTEVVTQTVTSIPVKKPKPKLLKLLPMCAEPTPSPTVDPTTEPTTEPTVQPTVEPSVDPSPTAPVTPEPTEPPVVEPSEPEGIIESTCDQLIFTINNPEDGETITVDFVPNEGDTLTVTVGPGESGVAEFDAFEGLEVTPVVEGFEDESEAFAWELPEDCDTGGEGGGSLPVTGAAAGGLAAGAVALLAIGGVLFYLARRRRVTFTA